MMSSQIRWVTRPARANLSNTNGVLSDGKNVGWVSTWKCRCGTVELPLVPIKPSCWPFSTWSPTLTCTDFGSMCRTAGTAPVRTATITWLPTVWSMPGIAGGLGSWSLFGSPSCAATTVPAAAATIGCRYEA